MVANREADIASENLLWMDTRVFDHCTAINQQENAIVIVGAESIRTLLGHVERRMDANKKVIVDATCTPNI